MVQRKFSVLNFKQKYMLCLELYCKTGGFFSLAINIRKFRDCYKNAKIYIQE